MTGKLSRRIASSIALALIGLSSWACTSPSSSGTDPFDKQTNWLKSCNVKSDCGASQDCLCGACTETCTAQSDCQALPGSSCVPASVDGAVALCGGAQPTVAGLCLPSCDDSSPCFSGQMCVAGVCAPVPTPTAHVTLDTTSHRQVLTGLGATVGYAEDAITAHPRKSALYKQIFADLGLDVLRFRDRFGYTGADDLSSAEEINREATASLHHAPIVLLGSWSPPGVLKANGTVLCQGNYDTCTLVQLADGSFDYASYATYWRGTLDAYATHGITPDYIGIQNNPDWIPSSVEMFEACKFLPKEGTDTAIVNGVSSKVRYPGYDEALTAILAQFDGLASPPKIVAPEVTAASLVAGYVDSIDMSRVDAIGHHLYGTDPTIIDPTPYQTLSALGQQFSRPVFQTEMQADGFGTAVLMHNVLVLESASMYVQTTLIGPAASPGLDPTALVTLGPTDYTLEAPYYAMRQYSAFTDPGSIRVDTTSDSVNLLASAWLSSDGTQVSVVMINAGRDTADVQLDPGAFGASSSRVVRTVFDGKEQTAELGSLSKEHIVQIPVRSVVTVQFTQ